MTKMIVASEDLTAYPKSLGSTDTFLFEKKIYIYSYSYTSFTQARYTDPLQDRINRGKRKRNQLHERPFQKDFSPALG